MPNGKRCYQDQDFLPVAHQVNCAKRDYEEYVIISVLVIENMIFAQLKVQFKLAHRVRLVQYQMQVYGFY